MAIKIKTQEEIEKLRIAGKLAADVLDMLTPHVVAGISTGELNEIAHNYMVNEQQTIPATLGYHGFPASSCISINHVVCHGIPDYSKRLKKGDIVNIDITVIKDGYHGDTSMMFEVGEVKPYASRLCRVARECMWLGIEQVKPEATLYDVAAAIEDHAHKNNFSVVKEYCGHGIGADFHEEPQVLHYRTPELKNIVLKPGMVFTIEPMINLGKSDIRLLGDNWTVVTKDKKLSAQWEHTILVTESGYEAFTLRQNETPILP
ncbi:type I methionyl aminopeptidase [Hydrogenovibrio marinus]|uniref:Methionine aminopeptidase n=1 Tax=Hydrogenovibrio marinus TaxID=28885 RepID=A0A066ZN50_HYDMR|nr:type I methionyl aminopeptidase [Hydrogenovibrio marinus]KDN95218.1 methionine aminopeptidase [Hydrogenovibrio marinus]BBN59695.1 methionine aminopeptidase [Hydrogenovibrio marinus]